MTRFALDLSRAVAMDVVAAANLLDGYPSRGVHVGGGRHVDVPASWDGTGTVPVGWSSHSPRAKPGNGGLYGVTLPPETQARLADAGRRARLSAAQRTLMDGLTLVDALPPDWQ